MARKGWKTLRWNSNYYKSKPQYIVANHILILFFLLFLLGIFGGYYYIKSRSNKRVEESLRSFTIQVEEGLQYKNGTWDTSFYSADSSTPHPRGSSGFATPLYIITTDGFVIERNNPIKGFLDSSNFEYPLAFQQPKTIQTVTQESWRVVSEQLRNKGESIGIVMVSYYEPDERILETIDKKLLESLRYIISKIHITNDQIDTEQLNIKNIHYDVAFEVVDKFNKVLVNNGRMPIFIDRSYIADELRHKDALREVNDIYTKESFSILSTPVYDNNKRVVGVIVVGKSINETKSILKDYIIITSVLSLSLGLLVITFTILPQKKESEGTLQKDKSSLPKKLWFDKKRSVIHLDETLIKIPYASNQYYLCDAVFSNPQKRWEQDELLKKFGNEDAINGWRIIYDAALTINKKTSLKLIRYQDKTFMLHPHLVNLVTTK